jgi:hypothetical protein
MSITGIVKTGMVNNGINMMINRGRGMVSYAVVYPCAVPLCPASE